MKFIRNKKLFVTLSITLNLVPCAYYLFFLFPSALIPLYFINLAWISIPSILFGLIGIPFFELLPTQIHEVHLIFFYFKITEVQATPKNIYGFILIVLFWILFAFTLTIIIEKIKYLVIQKYKKSI